MEQDRPVRGGVRMDKDEDNVDCPRTMHHESVMGRVASPENQVEARPNIRTLIELNIEDYERKIRQLRALSKALPVQMPSEADAALYALIYGNKFGG